METRTPTGVATTVIMKQKVITPLLEDLEMKQKVSCVMYEVQDLNLFLSYLHGLNGCLGVILGD